MHVAAHYNNCIMIQAFIILNIEQDSHLTIAQVIPTKKNTLKLDITYVCSIKYQ